MKVQPPDGSIYIYMGSKKNTDTRGRPRGDAQAPEYFYYFSYRKVTGGDVVDVPLPPSLSKSKRVILGSNDPPPTDMRHVGGGHLVVIWLPVGGVR